MVQDIKTLVVIMRTNRQIYEMLAPKNHLLPFWDIWTKAFRLHTYDEIRIMFALSR